MRVKLAGDQDDMLRLGYSSLGLITNSTKPLFLPRSIFEAYCAMAMFGVWHRTLVILEASTTDQKLHGGLVCLELSRGLSVRVISMNHSWPPPSIVAPPLHSRNYLDLPM